MGRQCDERDHFSHTVVLVSLLILQLVRGNNIDLSSSQWVQRRIWLPCSEQGATFNDNNWKWTASSKSFSQWLFYFPHVLQVLLFFHVPHGVPAGNNQVGGERSLKEGTAGSSLDLGEKSTFNHDDSPERELVEQTPSHFSSLLSPTCASQGLDPSEVWG